MNKLFTLKQKPNAILITSYKLSTGCFETLMRHGISVPNDIALAGFSNADIAELINPSLTVVGKPDMKMEQAAIEVLLQLIKRVKDP